MKKHKGSATVPLATAARWNEILASAEREEWAECLAPGQVEMIDAILPNIRQGLSLDNDKDAELLAWKHGKLTRTRGYALKFEDDKRAYKALRKLMRGFTEPGSITRGAAEAVIRAIITKWPDMPAQTCVVMDKLKGNSGHLS